MLYWNSIYLFLVTRNAKKAKKKEEPDEDFNAEAETDSEKEEGDSSTTSDTEDDEGEEEKEANTTPDKSIAKRCVKSFILTVIPYFAINEYIKKMQCFFYQDKIKYTKFFFQVWCKH